MSYFAAAAVRGPRGWTATEFDLSDVADIGDVAERLREAGDDARVALLFVESDDDYLVVLRLDDGEDLRVFAADGTFATESRLGAILLGEVEEPALDFDDDVAEEGTGEESPAVSVADAEPVGDPDLLSDLGVSAHRLLALCAREGMLPSDITAEISQGLGCGDEIEELREA
ncbi:MAG: tRNA adenosine deaminase-associated protein [Dactylosporangium sp.]|nr:tRNA adenosine deaminase-associated protein [Dactylosporangium sp.]NNJ61657.1 tRNA adenosine deaminase-associated protein [Dactylosporangium sp.]